jgi:hypothetical protein
MLATGSSADAATARLRMAARALMNRSVRYRETVA